MTDCVAAFLDACRTQEANGTPSEYMFDRKLIRSVNVYLANLDYDEPQEEFFMDVFVLGLRSTEAACITVAAHTVDHFKEFLQGARNHGD